MAESLRSVWSAVIGDSSIKISFSMTCFGESKSSEATTSPEYSIENLVILKFKGTCEMAENRMLFKFSHSSKKHELAKDQSIKFSISCEKLEYTKTGLITHDHWSDWQQMGHRIAHVSSNSKIYFIVDTFVITVYEDKKDTILTKLYTDNDFADFHLVTPDGSVAVHKAFLASHSDVFKAMLTNEWKETVEGQITMEGVTVETLNHLKEYMYLGTVPLDNVDGLRPLLLLARCYLIEDLKKQCIKRLADTVVAENMFSLMEFACDNNIPELACAMLVTAKGNDVTQAYDSKKENDLKKQV